MTAVFFTNIIRIFRNKINLLFMIVMPVVLIVVVMAMGTGEAVINCGIVDYDKSEFTEDFISRLKSMGSIKIIKEDQIQDKLINQTIDCAIVIPEGFTDGIINNKDVQVQSYTLQETNATTPFLINVQSYLDSARNIALSAGGDESRFYEGMSYYEDENMKINTQKVSKTGKNLQRTSTSMGFLVMSMLFFTSFGQMIILKDKETKIVFRILSAPITMRKYMIVNIISFFMVSVLQVTLIFGFLQYVIKANLGPYPLYMYIVSLVFSLVCVSLGVAVTSISKDTRQSAVIMSLIISPMCMLAGCWWPKSFMPDTLLKIAKFVPPTWIMDAYDKLLHGSTLADVTKEILVMLGFTVVFFLLGTWKKTDIAR